MTSRTFYRTGEDSGRWIECGAVSDGGNTFYRQRVETYSNDAALTVAGTDAAGRRRVSQLTTILDGKHLRDEESLIWGTEQTGTGAFAEGRYDMSVTAGQYVIRQTRRFLPYFSGKVQLVEMTFDTFAPQDNVVKRAGYFSTSTTPPFSADIDGIWIESSGGEVRFRVSREGTDILNVPQSSWNGEDLSAYNWDNFTVIFIDFLWLGGAVARLFVKSGPSFLLAHQFDYAGTAQNTFTRSPNQPLRFELTSTTGTGSFRSICSQLATEGSISENAKGFAVYNPTLLSANSAGTTYVLKAVRKLSAKRDIAIHIDSTGAVVSTTNDSGLLFLLINPTLSGALSYTDTGNNYEEATGAGETVTADGTVVEVIPIRSAGESKIIPLNILAWLGDEIDGTVQEYVLAYRPLTSNQSVAGNITLRVYN